MLALSSRRIALALRTGFWTTGCAVGLASLGLTACEQATGSGDSAGATQPTRGVQKTTTQKKTTSSGAQATENRGSGGSRNQSGTAQADGSTGNTGSAEAAKSQSAEPSSSSGAQPQSENQAGAGSAQGQRQTQALPPASSDAQMPPAGAASIAAQRCRPETDFYSVLEGDFLSITLACLTSSASATAWVVGELPRGATYDESTSTLHWTPTTDQAGIYSVAVQAEPWGETSTLDINVLDRSDSVQAANAGNTDEAQEQDGLPILHLYTDPGLNDDAYTPAKVVYRGHTYAEAQAKLRGMTSAHYPKRSFTLKFTKQDKFSEPQLAGGFLNKRKVTVITTFDDNSYVRQRLGYELWNRLDPDHIRVQAYNAVVYLNGQYYGLYTIADHVDGFLMEDFGYDQRGNLYKGRGFEANFRDTAWSPNGQVAKTTLHDGFTKEEGTPEEGQPGAYDDLDALMSWVARSPAEEFRQTIDATIARKEYEDWWVWVSYIRADDSIGKNSYHYHDPKRADAVWHYIPWDLNASFGQDWRTLRTTPDTSGPDEWYRGANGLFERMLDDPSLEAGMRERYRQALRGSLSRDKVLSLLDAMVKEVEPSALRDEALWGGAYRSFMAWRERTDFTTFHEEVAYLRGWVDARYSFLLEKLAAPP
jgi:spore coat protein CotH